MGFRGTIVALTKKQQRSVMRRSDFVKSLLWIKEWLSNEYCSSIASSEPWTNIGSRFQPSTRWGENYLLSRFLLNILCFNCGAAIRALHNMICVTSHLQKKQHIRCWRPGIPGYRQQSWWSTCMPVGIHRRADSRFAHSQCETSLKSNAVSHWLDPAPVYQSHDILLL